MFFSLSQGETNVFVLFEKLKRGRYNGKCDIGLCIVTFIRELQRINIDETNSVYHIKIKEKKVFDQWLEQIAIHRNYRQKILVNQAPSARSLSRQETIETCQDDQLDSNVQQASNSADRLFYNGSSKTKSKKKKFPDSKDFVFFSVQILPIFNYN